MKLNTDFISSKNAQALENAHKNSFCLKNDVSLLVREYQNAIVAPHNASGVWVNGKRLPQTLRHRMPLDKEKSPTAQILKAQTVVFVGSFTPVWGHEITDNLKHLWFYFDKHFAHLKNFKFVYVDFIVGKTSSPNFWALLKNLGLPLENFECITQPTQFARVFVPDESFFCDLNIESCKSPASDAQDVMKYCRRFTPEFLNTLKHLPQLAVPEHWHIEKVYFSRAAFYSQKDFNEKAIENFFKNQGFEIIYPEKNTFLENLAILQNAKVFAATDGSIAHNALFCKKARQIIILRKCQYFSTYQCAANAVVAAASPNVEIVYIDAAFSPLADHSSSWWSGPFFLYISNNLRRFFHLPEQKNDFPLGQFCKFLLLDWPRELPFYLDHKFLHFTHPIRAQWQLGTKLRRLFKKKNPR